MTEQARTAGGWSQVTLAAAGALSALLGLMVLVGWYTGNPQLLQIRPDRQWIAMVYNTALSFLLCGTGLLAVAFGRLKPATVCGVLPLLLGLLNLVQHLADADLGIDQLLLSHDNLIGRVGTPHPGRMAPQTSLCFVLAGMALLLMALPKPPTHRPLLVGLLGSALVALGVVGAFGYLVGMKTYGWGRYLPIAVHTAAGFAILGTGILAFAWRDGRTGETGGPRWLPVPVGLAVVAATLCLWQALIAEVTFSVPAVTLVMGFLMAGLLALSVYLTQTAIRTVGAIREAVARLSSASAAILASTTEQARGVSEQAAAVTQTMAAVAEVAQTAEQTIQRAKGVGESVQHTIAIGREGCEAVEASITSIREVRGQGEATAENILQLADRARAIGDIITSVTAIAERTNLLALNAAIEASRAGAHGKGFGVVAAEVKALADQSKKAAGQVGRILREIQTATQRAVLSTEQGTKTSLAATQVVARAGETITALADTLAQTGQATSQIEASVRQQAIGMTQINQAMQDIERVSRRNLGSIGEVEQAARYLDALSKRLTTLAGRPGQGPGRETLSRDRNGQERGRTRKTGAAPGADRSGPDP